MSNPIAWYSPATGLLISDGQYILMRERESQLPADLTALTWDSEIQVYQRLFAECQQQLQDTICALESAREELKQIAADLNLNLVQ